MSVLSEMQNIIKKLDVHSDRDIGLAYALGIDRGVKKLTEVLGVGDSVKVINSIRALADRQFNIAQDHEELGSPDSVTKRAKAEYEVYEEFIDQFQSWLKTQDFDTVVTHSVSESIMLTESGKCHFWGNWGDLVARMLFDPLVTPKIYSVSESRGKVTKVIVDLNGLKQPFTSEEFREYFCIYDKEYSI
ncbi:hypothetical protein ACV1QZ_22010 [Bacillus subtilis]|uniref:hypothetical protein n=1 Tax=Bacillus licheniformis TaxID=1402 RepID=UPI000E5501F8|nr:hypothetical protein [Bacillus licheniformis]RHL12403.1 hypothetical protein DW032_19380 [Bacillus licheniformis]